MTINPTDNQTTGPAPATAIQGPGQIISAIPYLLGFHPCDSLVIVGLREQGQGYRLIVTARLDLADVSSLLRQTLTAIRRGEATHAVAITYLPDLTDQPGAHRAHRPQLTTAALEARFDAAQLSMIDALVVVDGRWSSQCCDDPDCCPPLGRLLPTETSEFQAAATYAGVQVARSREGLVEQLQPAPDRGRLEPAIHAAGQTRLDATLAGRGDTWERGAVRALHAAARAAAQPGAAMCTTDEQAARFAVALAAISVRDKVWLAIDSRRLPTSPLWADLARRLPQPFDTAPAFLHAWQAWRAGDGATAGIANTQALASEPKYSAGLLLATALEQGINPRTMPPLRQPTQRHRHESSRTVTARTVISD